MERPGDKARIVPLSSFIFKITCPFLLLDHEQADKEEKEGEDEKKEEDEKDEMVELKCCVMLQKENAEGLIDEECGKPVEVGHAGLCE